MRYKLIALLSAAGIALITSVFLVGDMIHSSDSITRNDDSTSTGTDDGSFEENYGQADFWDERIDSAFDAASCPPVEEKDFPEGYYTGPLIDSHFHIPPLPDWYPGEEEEVPEPILGIDTTIPDIVCTLEHEGTKSAMSFFNVWTEIDEPLLEVVKRSSERYPDTFIRFIQPPTQISPTVEAPVLRDMLSVHPGLFQGYGEVGFSPTEYLNPPPDDSLYVENFEVAEENNLIVNFHIGRDHIDEMETALKENPNVIFVSHSDGLTPELERMIGEYPNFYFTMDEIYFTDPINGFMEGERGNKEEFISTVENNFDHLVNKAVNRWEPRIEQNPDKYLWGTDRSDAKWAYDRDVGLLLTKLARAIIGELDPSVQEKVAYKNAEDIISKTQNDEKKTEERIVLSQPFEKYPYDLVPMGENVTHDGEPHVGIDFFWREEVKILASAPGEVIFAEEGNYEGTYDVFVRSGEYTIGYTHLGELNPDIKVGYEVERGEWLGNNWLSIPEDNHWAIHWEFGYHREGWERFNLGHRIPHPERLCPMTYFTNDVRTKLENIYNSTKWVEDGIDYKEFFPYVCSGPFEGKDE